MDAGLFLVSKKRMVFWIIGPVLCLGILSLSFFTYFKLRDSSLKEKRSFYEYMPIVSQKISGAKDILARYKTKSSETDPREDLNSLMPQMAKRNNFVISSLKIEKDPRKSSGKGISVFKVALKGKGSLSAIIGFLNETSAFNRLFAVEDADIRVANLNAVDSHSADLVFSYYALE